MNKRGYPRRPRDGDDLQHAARQRPDLVVRGEQLPARATSPSRSTCCTGTRIPPACRRGCTASTCARCTRRTCWREPGGDHACTACRSTCGRSRCRAISCLDAGGPYRAVEIDLSRRRRSTGGPKRFVLAASRPHRRRGQPAGQRQVQPLDQRATCRPTRRNGSRAPPRSPAPGGRTGSAGSAAHGKEQVPARVPGDGKLLPIEDAPGSYVKVRVS